MPVCALKYQVVRHRQLVMIDLQKANIQTRLLVASSLPKQRFSILCSPSRRKLLDFVPCLLKILRGKTTSTKQADGGAEPLQEASAHKEEAQSRRAIA